MHPRGTPFSPNVACIVVKAMVESVLDAVDAVDVLDAEKAVKAERATDMGNRVRALFAE